jgi:autotransporter-associated beta strand protein
MRRIITKTLRRLLVAGMALCAAASATAAVVNFADLGPGPNAYYGPGGGNYWNGPTASFTDQPDPSGGTDEVGAFQSGGVSFVNRYNITYGSWSGFAYSDCTDQTTAGYTNQFSAYTVSASGGSGNYGIDYGYVDNLNPAIPTQLDQLPYLTLPVNAQIQGAYVTNTTYAALSMLNGDQFAKQFAAGDWFALTVYGTNANNALLANSVTFYLADYRQLNGTPDYIISQWTPVDLSSLAGATCLYFNLTSSDYNGLGMLTPAYFAINDIRYAIDGAWGASGGGSWSASGKWQGSSIPGSAGDTATFGAGIGSAVATITLDGSRCLTSLGFSTTGGGSYIIARSGGDTTSTLTLTNTSGAVSIANSGGNQTIAAPVVLGSNLSISATTGSSLTVSGPIGETSPGTSVTLSGGGELILSGSNTYTGGTTISGGTLDFASPAALPTTGIINISRPGSVSLLGLLAEIPAGQIVESDDDTVVAPAAGLPAVATATAAEAPEPPPTVSGGGVGLAAADSVAEATRAAAVPEPSTLILLGAGAIALFGWTLRGPIR